MEPYMTQHDINARDFGRLEAEVEQLRNELREHKDESRAALMKATSKIDELLTLANKGRGAWWAGMVMASGFGAVISHLAYLWKN
jgi:hypothetical protein